MMDSRNKIEEVHGNRYRALPSGPPADRSFPGPRQGDIPKLLAQDGVQIDSAHNLSGSCGKLGDFSKEQRTGMTVADAVIGSECNCDDGTRDHAAVDNPGPGEDLLKPTMATSSG